MTVFKEVYLGLGGNIGPTIDVLHSVLEHIEAIDEVHQLRVSNFYETTPVSDIPQHPYINAACHFLTTLSPHDLLDRLEKITLLHGQLPKPKNAPRIVDIDILHFGGERHGTPQLEIPHPRWTERLFVLIPLLDLTTNVQLQTDKGEPTYVDIKELVQNFSNINQEFVKKVMVQNK